jgi:hypothetical protein
MHERKTAPFGKAEGRSFGLTVGIAFLVLTAFLAWRSSERAMYITGAIGVLLVLGGLIIPAQLRPVHRAWMALALAMSKVTTPIFMGIIYFLVLTPFGIVRRTAGAHPLRHKATGGSYWKSRDPAVHGDIKRQF